MHKMHTLTPADYLTSHYPIEGREFLIFHILISVWMNIFVYTSSYIFKHVSSQFPEWIYSAEGHLGFLILISTDVLPPCTKCFFTEHYQIFGFFPVNFGRVDYFKSYLIFFRPNNRILWLTGGNEIWFTQFVQGTNSLLQLLQLHTHN